MRFVHLADTHLGFRASGRRLDPVRSLNQRECDVYAAWHRAIDIAVERRVDAVIHAGDLFDAARPSPRALAEAIDGFARLRDAAIEAVVIAGNHETPRFRSAGSVFEVLERFGVHAVWSAPRTIRIGATAVHAVPHRSDAARMRADVEDVRLDATADANILVLHAGLEAMPRPTYDEVNEIALDPVVLAEADVDYIALGHLHRYRAPQIDAIYPGSLERLDFADLDGEKAVLEVNLAAGAGQAGFVTKHPLSPRTVLDLPIECAGCDPAAVLSAVEAGIGAYELDGAVVRVRLEAIQRDVHQALDFERLDALFDPCLHHVVAASRDGLRLGGPDDGPDQREIVFADWARPRVPTGLDADAVVELAQGFLSDAAVAEVEAEAAH